MSLEVSYGFVLCWLRGFAFKWRPLLLRLWKGSHRAGAGRSAVSGAVNAAARRKKAGRRVPGTCQPIRVGRDTDAGYRRAVGPGGLPVRSHSLSIIVVDGARGAAPPSADNLRYCKIMLKHETNSPTVLSSTQRTNRHCIARVFSACAREEVCTPLYVYSAGQVLDRYRLFFNAFGHRDHLICYSVKANSNLSILKLLESQGSGFDIVSGGELCGFSK